MPKRYFTTSKTGEEVEVSAELAKQLVSTGKKKQEDFTVEDIAVETPPQPAPQTPRQVTVQEALFPRATMAVESSKPYFKQAMAAGLDLLSGPGRMAASSTAGSQPDVKQSGKGMMLEWKPEKEEDTEKLRQEALRALKKTEGSGFLENIIRDPATGAVVLTLPLTGPIAGAAQLGKMAPVVAGAAEGAISAVTHQAENMAKGKKASPGDAALEVAMTAAIPGAGILGKKAMKKAGAKMLESVIKPKKKLTEAIGTKFDIDNMWKYGLDSPKGLKVMERKIDDFRKAIKRQYKTVMPPKKERINILEILEETKEELMNEVAAKKYASEYKGIVQGLEFWDEYFKKNHPLGQVDVSIPEAISIRRGVGKLSKYDKMDVNQVKGVDMANQKLYAKINKALDKYPKLRKLDKKLAETAPLEIAVVEAVNRTQKNLPVSLHDLPGLFMVAGGAGYGAMEGGPTTGQGMAPGLAYLAATRGARSPGLAAAMGRTGRRQFPKTGFAARRAAAQGLTPKEIEEMEANKWQ